MIIIKQGDVFSHSKSVPIAHCISVSGNIMGMGFAKTLCNKYPRLKHNVQNIIKEQKLNFPNTVYLTENNYYNDHSRLIINLITKDHHSDKPTYATLKHTLLQLMWIIETYKLSEVCMPLIACGLDKLDPDKVIKLLKAYIPYEVNCYVYVDNNYTYKQINKINIYLSYYSNDSNISAFLLNQLDPKVGISLKQLPNNVYAKELYPTWHMIKTLSATPNLYEQAYVSEILSKITPQEIANKYNGKILRCFEAPVLSDGITPQFCHRQIIAKWLKSHLGDEINVWELRNKYCETDTLYL